MLEGVDKVRKASAQAEETNISHSGA